MPRECCSLPIAFDLSFDQVRVGYRLLYIRVRKPGGGITITRQEHVAGKAHHRFIERIPQENVERV